MSKRDILRIETAVADKKAILSELRAALDSDEGPLQSWAWRQVVKDRVKKVSKDIEILELALSLIAAS